MLNEPLITIEDCEKILNKNGNKRYTRDQIKAIREFLYQMAELQEQFKL